MSKETIEDLNTNTLIGYTEKRGTAWHYRAADQGEESNHYDGAIPVEDIERRLFHWSPVEGTISATALTEDGFLNYTDPDRKAIMRSDTGRILGIFKQGYQPHPYKEWLTENVAQILDADLHVGSAGLLKHGGVGWVQVEMEDTMEVQGLEYRPFLTAATSLDGSLSTTYGTGSQVVVCDNTLSVALSTTAEKLKIRHSRNSLLRITEAREALSIVHQAGDLFAAQVEELTSQYVSDDKWREFVKAYTYTPNNTTRSLNMAQTKASGLDDLWFNDERVAPWKNNAYGVVAAVNTFTHHVSNVKGDRAERNMSRSVMGEVDKLDQNTLRVLASV